MITVVCNKMKFVAHNGPCTCLSIGQKSGHVLVTGGEDKIVNLWAIGKYNVIMVSFFSNLEWS